MCYMYGTYLTFWTLCCFIEVGETTGDLDPQNFKHVYAFSSFLMCSLLAIRHLAYSREV